MAQQQQEQHHGHDHSISMAADETNLQPIAVPISQHPPSSSLPMIVIAVIDEQPNPRRSAVIDA